MDLPTSMLLFTLPVFAILSPLVQGLSKWVRSKMVVGWWAIIGLLVTSSGVVGLLLGGVTKPQVVLGVLSIDSYS
ncbi:MAG: hypothetical protein ABSD41_00945, partial [Candidatus Bathyarchaeia archaeon]